MVGAFAADGNAWPSARPAPIIKNEVFCIMLRAACGGPRDKLLRKIRPEDIFSFLGVVNDSKESLFGGLTKKSRLRVLRGSLNRPIKQVVLVDRTPRFQYPRQ